MSDTVAEVEQPQDTARRAEQWRREKKIREKFASSFCNIYIFNLEAP